MADFETEQTGNKKKKYARKKAMIRVDLTPMVDLAFLLITFFMLATKLQEEKQMLWEKKKETPNPEAITDCRVLNILIDSAALYTYEGSDLNTLQPSSFKETKGIRQVILNKAQRVKNECGHNAKGNPYSLVCLIKMLPGSKYKNMVAILDEMDTTHITDYSLQEPLVEEINALEAANPVSRPFTKE